MSRELYKLEDGTSYLRSMHILTRTFVAGADQTSTNTFVYVGTNAAAAAYTVEPVKRTGAGQAAQPSLDSLSRLILYTGLTGNIAANGLTVHMEYSRNNAAFVEVGDLAGYVVSTGGAYRCNVHVIDLPLPVGFMKNQAAASDVDDTLTCRMVVKPVATSGADVTVSCVATLVPGPLDASVNVSRGQIFG